MAKKRTAKKTAKKRTRRKSAKKRATRKPKPPPLLADVVDGLVLLLASGASPSAATDYAAKNAEMDPKTAAEHVEEAQKRIALAATFDRQEELGTAYTRLNMLFQRSTSQQDYKSALSAQRELNKLLRLYHPGEDEDGANPDRAGQSGDLDAVRQHLEPLELGPPDTPIEELARLAALAVLGAEL